MPGKRADGVKMRGIPVHNDLWKAAMAKAKREGVSLYELIRRFLRSYVDAE